MAKDLNTWIYHKTEEPQIIKQRELKNYEDKGWADSPAEFLTKKATGVDQDKVDQGDIQELMKAQQVVEAVKSVKDAANGAINLENMTKLQLETYARKHVGIELDRRKTKPKLITEINEALNGDS